MSLKYGSLDWMDVTNLRAQGSRFANGEEGEAAALNCLRSNPVGLRTAIVRRGRGAMIQDRGDSTIILRLELPGGGRHAKPFW